MAEIRRPGEDIEPRKMHADINLTFVPSVLARSSILRSRRTLCIHMYAQYPGRAWPRAFQKYLKVPRATAA